MPTRLRPRAGPARRATRATPGGWGRWGHGPRGQALAEFALLLPIVLLLTMTAIDFGRAFYTYEAIANAAREGARYCVLKLTTSSLSSRVSGELGGSVNLVSIAPSDCPSDAIMGSEITITVTGEYTPVTPLVSVAVGISPGGSFQMSASATMMMTQ